MATLPPPPTRALSLAQKLAQRRTSLAMGTDGRGGSTNQVNSITPPAVAVTVPMVNHQLQTDQQQQTVSQEKDITTHSPPTYARVPIYPSSPLVIQTLLPNSSINSAIPPEPVDTPTPTPARTGAESIENVESAAADFIDQEELVEPNDHSDDTDEEEVELPIIPITPFRFQYKPPTEVAVEEDDIEEAEDDEIEPDELPTDSTDTNHPSPLLASNTKVDEIRLNDNLTHAAAVPSSVGTESSPESSPPCIENGESSPSVVEPTPVFVPAVVPPVTKPPPLASKSRKKVSKASIPAPKTSVQIKPPLTVSPSKRQSTPSRPKSATVPPKPVIPKPTAKRKLPPLKPEQVKSRPSTGGTLSKKKMNVKLTKNSTSKSTTITQPSSDRQSRSPSTKAEPQSNSIVSNSDITRPLLPRLDSKSHSLVVPTDLPRADSLTQPSEYARKTSLKRPPSLTYTTSDVSPSPSSWPNSPLTAQRLAIISEPAPSASLLPSSTTPTMSPFEQYFHSNRATWSLSPEEVQSGELLTQEEAEKVFREIDALLPIVQPLHLPSDEPPPTEEELIEITEPPEITELLELPSGVNFFERLSVAKVVAVEMMQREEKEEEQLIQQEITEEEEEQKRIEYEQIQFEIQQQQQLHQAEVEQQQLDDQPDSFDRQLSRLDEEEKESTSSPPTRLRPQSSGCYRLPRLGATAQLVERALKTQSRRHYSTEAVISYATQTQTQPITRSRTSSRTFQQYYKSLIGVRGFGTSADRPRQFW